VHHHQWLADLGAVFYSLKSKTYSARDRRVTESEFSRKMELEVQMGRDRGLEEERRRREEEDEVERKSVVGLAAGGGVAAGVGGGVIGGRKVGVGAVQASRGGRGVVRRPGAKPGMAVGLARRRAAGF
jgi:hypothetical protein